MAVVGGFAVVPDRVRLAPGFVATLLLFGLARLPLRLDTSAMCSLFFGREPPANIGPPVLPAQAVAMVLESASRYAIQMQQIGTIALSAHPALNVAAVQVTICNDLVWQDEPPR